MSESQKGSEVSAPDKCPHCGTKCLHSYPMFCCGVNWHRRLDGTVTIGLPTELCKERSARQKAEDELAAIHATSASETIQSLGADLWAEQARNIQLLADLAEARAKLAEVATHWKQRESRIWSTLCEWHPGTATAIEYQFNLTNPTPEGGAK